MNSIERFVDAQSKIRQNITDELVAGQKQTHWMWFVFPQLKCLGVSNMSRFYGIENIDEAIAYVEHPILGSNIVDDVTRVAAHTDKNIYRIFGEVDGMKFQSCLTLFLNASKDPIFRHALKLFYNGKMDDKTLKALTST